MATVVPYVHDFRSLSGEVQASMPVQLAQNGAAEHRVDLVYVSAYGEGPGTTSNLLDRFDLLNIGAVTVGFHNYDLPKNLDKTPQDALMRACSEVLPSVLEEIAEGRGNRLPVISNSIGSLPIFLGMRASQGQNVADVATVNALGAANRGQTAYPTTAKFLGGFAYGTLTHPFHRQLSYMTRDILAEIGRDIKTGTFWQQSTWLNQIDIMPDMFDHAARGFDVTNLTGLSDRFIRAKHVLERFNRLCEVYPSESVSGKVRIITVPHLTHASVGFTNGLHAIIRAALIATRRDDRS